MHVFILLHYSKLLLFILFANQSSGQLLNLFNFIFYHITSHFYLDLFCYYFPVLCLLEKSFNFILYHIKLHFSPCIYLICISVHCMHLQHLFKLHFFHIALHSRPCILLHLHLGPQSIQISFNLCFKTLLHY